MKRKGNFSCKQENKSQNNSNNKEYIFDVQKLETGIDNMWRLIFTINKRTKHNKETKNKGSKIKDQECYNNVNTLEME